MRIAIPQLEFENIFADLPLEDRIHFSNCVSRIIANIDKGIKSEHEKNYNNEDLLNFRALLQQNLQPFYN